MERPHWHYFLALDNELTTIARYVELAPRNYGTYSVEMARLYLAAASEVDVVGKVLCKKVAPAEKRDNIGDLRKVITTNFPKLYGAEIVLPRYGITLVPWLEWNSGDRNPEWWKNYTDVKHHRYDYYHQANLENTLNAMAGLFVLVIYLHSSDVERIELEPWPQVLSVKNETVGMIVSFPGLTHRT
jgi:hypothetical protein